MPAAAFKAPPLSSSAAGPPTSSWAAKEYDLDDDGWEDMPIIRLGDNPLGLDDEDAKRFHYVPPEKISDGPTANAIGEVLDYDAEGHEWRAKLEQNESEYTRLRLDDDEDEDEAYLKTKYLFDEDKAMTPLSQMQQTKNLLTEAQRVAYVGLCSLTIREMIQSLKKVGSKELKAPIHGMELWGLRIMGRLYFHMELENAEQKMIESLAEHGVTAMDLVPPLMTTHTVRNPEYDPAEAAQKAEKDAEAEAKRHQESIDAEESLSESDPTEELPAYEEKAEQAHATAEEEKSESVPALPPAREIVQQTTLLQSPTATTHQTTQNVMRPNAPVAMPGVSTSLSSTDENVTLDIRWTVLCDLFLMLIADSVYDSRSRVLLEQIAAKMGLGWLDVVKFEKRVTDALEIQEGVEKMEQKDIVEGREAKAKTRRYMMVGLATLGGGLVIGLSAGLLAPVIGAGLGAALGTIGISGTSAFLGSAGGAAVITTTGVLTGSGIAGKGMARRTKQVSTFELLPLHNNKRVNCIITVPGFMSSAQDDVRLPFSVLDPVVGDVFSVLWEPDMMGETGNALKILTAEVLSTVSQTVLSATVMTALMGALQWPLILTKLGYLIDNPWSNALDRSVAAGAVLADILMNRNLGVRPITLVGFSLGARVIFYALVELAKHKAYGIIQDVILLGATVTAPTRVWHDVRGVVAGRLINGYARNDWILNYLFRATTGGMNTVAGLRPIEKVPGLENVDVTDKISGHMSYRIYMPVILEQLGFPVTATYFDEPEDLEEMWEKEYHKEQEVKKPKAKNRFSFFRKASKETNHVTPPPSTTPRHSSGTPRTSKDGDDDLPARVEKLNVRPTTPSRSASPATASPTADPSSPAQPPKVAGFDFKAIGEVLGKDDLDPNRIKAPQPSKPIPAVPLNVPLERSESAPVPADDRTPRASPTLRRSALHDEVEPEYTTPAPSVRRVASSMDDSRQAPQAEPAPSPASSYRSTSWSASNWQPRDDITPLGTEPTLSFGGFDGSITSTSSVSAAPVMSFGLADGSISSVSVADPWSVSSSSDSSSTKKPWASNPWT